MTTQAWQAIPRQTIFVALLLFVGDAVQLQPTDVSRAGSSGKPLELVIASYCGDDFTWMVQGLDCARTEVYLYSRCPKPENAFTITKGELPGCVTLQLLEDLGRESATWLQHLKANHDRFKASPAGVVVFVPGHIEGDWKGMPHLLKAAAAMERSAVGYSALSFATCALKFPLAQVKKPSLDAPGATNTSVAPRLLANLVRLYIGDQQDIEDNYVSGFKGQFLVSKSRAAEIPEWMYDYSLQMLHADPTGSESLYSRGFERSWNHLFGCWDAYRGDGKVSFPLCYDNCGNANKTCGPNKPFAKQGAEPPPGGQQRWMDSMLQEQPRMWHICNNAPVVSIADSPVRLFW